MISKLLRCLRLEKMIWRRGKSGVISNVEFGMLLILPCVVLASFLSTTVAWHHSPPVACAPSSVPSPPVPSAPSPVPFPPVPFAPSSVPSPPLVPSAPSSVPSPPLVPSAPSSVPSPPLVPSAPSSVPPPLVPSAPSSVPSPPLVPSAPSSVPSPRLAPSAPSSVPSPPAPFAPRSVPSPPFCSPSAPSPVPSPPFCSRSVATTVWSAFLALTSLMIDAWGEASAQVAFTGRDVGCWNCRKFWRKVVWTIVLGLNPIVGTFYVLQTTVVTRKFRAELQTQRAETGNHTYEVAKAFADSWVAVGVANTVTIPDEYKLDPTGVDPDPKLVLYLAGTGDPRQPQGTANTGGNTRAWPQGSSFDFFLLNYEGMLALLTNDVLKDVDYQQLRFLGCRTFLETVAISLQSISYIIAVVYRRAKHLHVAPVEGIGFACSLLFLVNVILQLVFESRSNQALLIYLTPAQEVQITNIPKNMKLAAGIDSGPCEWIWTFLVGSVVAVAATLLVYPVWASKRVDMLGHVIFFGDFLLQFIFLFMYFKKCGGSKINPNLLLMNLLIPGIIASAGMALAIYATNRHWHDQSFDIPTPSLGRYFPFIH